VAAACTSRGAANPTPSPLPLLLLALAIAAGSYHSLAVLGNESVAAWGLNDAGQSTVPTTLSSGGQGGAAVAASAGAWHSLALLADGHVVGWGSNADSRSTVPIAVASAQGMHLMHWRLQRAGFTLFR
jgi:hypothetical protein